MIRWRMLYLCTFMHHHHRRRLKFSLAARPTIFRHIKCCCSLPDEHHLLLLFEKLLFAPCASGCSFTRLCHQLPVSSTIIWAEGTNETHKPGCFEVRQYQQSHLNGSSAHILFSLLSTRYIWRKSVRQLCNIQSNAHQSWNNTDPCLLIVRHNPSSMGILPKMGNETERHDSAKTRNFNSIQHSPTLLCRDKTQQ